MKSMVFLQVGSTGDKPANQPCYYHGNQKGQSTTSILNLLFADFRCLRIPACVYFYVRVTCLPVPLLHRTCRRLPRFTTVTSLRTFQDTGCPC